MNNRIPGEDAALHTIAYPLLDSRKIILGHSAAEHGFGKCEPLIITGRECDLYMTVLPGAAGLLFMLAFDIDLFPYRLTIGYLRLCKINICAETVAKLSNYYVKVNIAETGYRKLLCFGIVLISYCRILLKQTRHASGNLILVSLCLRGHRHCHIRLRELYRCVFYIICTGCQGIICICIHKLCGDAYVSATELINIYLLLAAHHENFSEFLRLTADGVAKLHIFFESAGHDLEHRHFTYKGIGYCLENKYRCNRALRVNSYLAYRSVVLYYVFVLLCCRARKRLCYRIEKRFYPPVLYSRTAEYRHYFALDYSLVYSLKRFLTADRNFIEELIHKLITGLRYRLNEH